MLLALIQSLDSYEIQKQRFRRRRRRVEFRPCVIHRNMLCRQVNFQHSRCHVLPSHESNRYTVLVNILRLLINTKFIIGHLTNGTHVDNIFRQKYIYHGVKDSIRNNRKNIRYLMEGILLLLRRIFVSKWMVLYNCVTQGFI